MGHQLSKYLSRDKNIINLPEDKNDAHLSGKGIFILDYDIQYVYIKL
jgi:hypothetical protein